MTCRKKNPRGTQGWRHPCRHMMESIKKPCRNHQKISHKACGENKAGVKEMLLYSYKQAINLPMLLCRCPLVCLSLHLALLDGVSERVKMVWGMKNNNKSMRKWWRCLVCLYSPTVLTLAATEEADEEADDDDRAKHWQRNDQGLEVYWVIKKIKSSVRSRALSVSKWTSRRVTWRHGSNSLTIHTTFPLIYN